ncbi:Hypothetical predicted protein [Cloeon dipterum]|uniref:Uncharacterized protein n=1 Tax=Cloeon dipterum TaxID=197152 RepID=A0A8S1CKS7_9INSE|nr:Hypothetical predicted protein [Cloeon dipterum]
MFFRLLLLAALLAFAFANTANIMNQLESRIYSVDVSSFAEPESNVEITDAYGETDFETGVSEFGGNKQSLALKSNILWISTFVFSLFFTVACFIFDVPFIFL